MSLFMRNIKGILSAALIVFCVKVSASASQLAPDPTKAPNGQVMAAWSQVIGNDPSDFGSTQDVLPLKVMLRFVLSGAGANCGDFNVIPDPLPEDETTLKSSLAFSPRSNPDSVAFPIVICESLMPVRMESARLVIKSPNQAYDDPTVQLWQPAESTDAPVDVVFQGPYSIGRRNLDGFYMVSFGDSGCRDNDEQTCSDKTQWRLPKISTTASTMIGINPDLVIHVGDYRYDSQTNANKWKFWYSDFFYPARELLIKSPWAFSRGNHEKCSSGTAGEGWLFFLQPKQGGASTGCPGANGGKLYIDPWFFDVAIKPDEDGEPLLKQPHRFIMIDTAHGSVRKSDIATAMKWAGETSPVWGSAQPSAWWVTHKPAWGVSTDSGHAKSSDSNLQTAIATASRSGVSADRWVLDDLPLGLKAILTGHIHLLQSVTFYGADNTSYVRPKQIIVGDGGVVSDPGFTSKPCLFHFEDNGKSATGVVNWNTDHGFTVWKRKASASKTGWVGQNVLFSDGTGTDSSVHLQDSSSSHDYPDCISN